MVLEKLHWVHVEPIWMNELSDAHQHLKRVTFYNEIKHLLNFFKLIIVATKYLKDEHKFKMVLHGHLTKKINISFSLLASIYWILLRKKVTFSNQCVIMTNTSTVVFLWLSVYEDRIKVAMVKHFYDFNKWKQALKTWSSFWKKKLMYLGKELLI